MGNKIYIILIALIIVFLNSCDTVRVLDTNKRLSRLGVCKDWYYLAGYVKDAKTEAPIDCVTVLLDNHRFIQTDTVGHFFLSRDILGDIGNSKRLCVSFDKKGYIPRTITLKVGIGHHYIIKLKEKQK